MTPLKKENCIHEGCGKKLKLTDFPCRCGKHFCSSHRFSEQHKCVFDYQKECSKTLIKDMIPISTKKIQTI